LRQTPQNLGLLQGSLISDKAGLLAAKKVPYEVELQPVLAEHYPMGLRLSTREDRMIAMRDVTLRTSDGGTVTIGAKNQLPVGMQLDVRSGTLITPQGGVRLPDGKVVTSQTVDANSFTGGQQLKPGTKETGDWIVIRRTVDDRGDPIFDAYHMSNAMKEKKWTHRDGNIYQAKTDEPKFFVLAPDTPTAIVPSYGGLAYNEGPGVLVKEAKGFYFIGIEELKQTHIGDARTQQIIDRTWAKYKAQKTGGVWSPSHPTEYAIPYKGGWRVIRADGTAVVQPLSWAG